MLSYGFGDPIAGFANPHNESWRDTPHLTTPWSFGGWATSSRGAFAFAPRGHRVSTSATHLGTVEGRQLFLYPLFTGVGPVRVLGHGHGPVLGVVVWVDLGWRFEWTCGAPRDDPPLHTL